MPIPPNMLRARTRGITRLSWSMTKVRKLELTGTRQGLRVFGVRLTDRALAAGDSPAGARVVDDSPCPPGHNTPVPLERSPPVSFKRLLGGSIGYRELKCTFRGDDPNPSLAPRNNLLEIVNRTD